MAAETGNANISGTMADSIEIPTANLGSLTMASWKKVSQAISTTIDNRKWQYGRQNRKYFYLCNYDRQDRNCNGKLWIFDHDELEGVFGQQR